MKVHVDVAFGRRQRDHPTGLRGAHHRRHVLLGEHPLDGDDIRMMSVQPVVNRVADGQQPTRQRLVGRRTDHVDVQSDDLSATVVLHHRQAAAGQSRVDAHNAHYKRLYTERLFDTLLGGIDSCRQDTR